jgi:hypothetical protein
MVSRLDRSAPQRFEIGLFQPAADIDLGDSEFGGAGKIIRPHRRRAVQHERRRQFRQTLDAVEVKPDHAPPVMVDLADIDGERVDARVVNESPSRAELRRSNLLPGVLRKLAGDACEALHLGLDGCACGVRLRDEIGDGSEAPRGSSASLLYMTALKPRRTAPEHQARLGDSLNITAAGTLTERETDKAIAA